MWAYHPQINRDASTFDNFFSIFSKIGFQIEAILNEVPYGIPKYFIGKLPTLQWRILDRTSRLLTSPIGTISFFPTLTFNPVKAWKQDKANLVDNSCSLEVSQNKIVSSANNKWETCTPTEFTAPTWKSRIRLLSVFLKILLKTSIIKRNKSKKNHLVSNHESFQKKPSRDPFTRTEKRTEVTQALIHPLHFTPKPSHPLGSRSFIFPFSNFIVALF